MSSQQAAQIKLAQVNSEQIAKFRNQCCEYQRHLSPLHDGQNGHVLFTPALETCFFASAYDTHPELHVHAESADSVGNVDNVQQPMAGKSAQLQSSCIANSCQLIAAKACTASICQPIMS